MLQRSFCTGCGPTGARCTNRPGVVCKRRFNRAIRLVLLPTDASNNPGQSLQALLWQVQSDTAWTWLMVFLWLASSSLAFEHTDQQIVLNCNSGSTTAQQGSMMPATCPRKCLCCKASARAGLPSPHWMAKSLLGSSPQALLGQMHCWQQTQLLCRAGLLTSGHLGASLAGRAASVSACTACGTGTAVHWSGLGVMECACSPVSLRTVMCPPRLADKPHKSPPPPFPFSSPWAHV